MGVILILTGIANVFIIKGKKEKTPQMKLWIHFFSLKFMLTLLLTPAIKPLQALFAFDEERKLQIQFWIIIFLFVYSIGIKGYREDIANNFDPDLLG